MTARLPLVALLVALALGLPAARALGDLGEARRDRDTARARASAGMPGPVAAPAPAFPADGAEDARRRLAARIGARATHGGVLLETLAGDSAVPGTLAAVVLRASGPEKAVLAFVDTLERDAGPVRMRAWRLTPAPGGVRIEARMVAAWRG